MITKPTIPHADTRHTMQRPGNMGNIYFPNTYIILYVICTMLGLGDVDEHNIFQTYKAPTAPDFNTTPITANPNTRFTTADPDTRFNTADPYTTHLLRILKRGSLQVIIIQS